MRMCRMQSRFVNHCRSLLPVPLLRSSRTFDRWTHMFGNGCGARSRCRLSHPLVEVAPHPQANADVQNAEPVREPLPKPVARPIVEVVADWRQVDAQDEEPELATPNGKKIKT